MGVLAGKVALVTGAGKGMGAVIARLFAREGARVALAARTLGDVEKVAGEIGDQALAVRLDVARREDWAAAIAAVEERWGKLNILVNCAGVSQAASIEDADEDNWRKHIATNLDGVFYGCQAALPLMKASGEAGSIVNIGSAFALRPMGAFAAYSSTKAAVITLTKTIALHCATQGYNIRANMVHPGGTETAMLEQALADTGLPRQDAYDYFAKIHPMGRLGKPEEVAQAVLWLASDASSFTTGAEISVDGGSAIRE
jgi:NAD(P)-dependent dehydrogenase (short-subunit alcohol dehydrogenase family)